MKLLLTMCLLSLINGQDGNGCLATGLVDAALTGT